MNGEFNYVYDVSLCKKSVPKTDESELTLVGNQASIFIC